jgi:hypothetical protein
LTISPVTGALESPQHEAEITFFACQAISRRSRARRAFKFHKGSQLFIRADNETLFVAAMRVCNPDRSARWNQSLRHSPMSSRVY